MIIHIYIYISPIPTIKGTTKQLAVERWPSVAMWILFAVQELQLSKVRTALGGFIDGFAVSVLRLENKSILFFWSGLVFVFPQQNRGHRFGFPCICIIAYLLYIYIYTLFISYIIITQIIIINS